MKKVYVGNLTFDLTEDELRQLFEPYGQVENVRIITDRDTGRPRGFGFVEMSDEESARKAMTSLHGTSLRGRSLKVSGQLPGEEQLPPRKHRRRSKPQGR